MPRPRLRRHVSFNPQVYYFKPRGIPLNKLECESLSYDEIESLKLYEIDKLDQISSSEKMKISQPTFARILGSAHEKIARAILFGKAIKIEKL